MASRPARPAPTRHRAVLPARRVALLLLLVLAACAAVRPAEALTSVYAGGWFTRIGSTTTTSYNFVGEWNNETEWTTVGQGANLVLNALAVFNGSLIAGGYQTSMSGVTVNHVGSWSTLTKAWTALGTGTDNAVFALAVYGQALVAGGAFAHAGGNAAASIALWNGSDWSPIGTGMDGEVTALAVLNDELIAGGSFSTAGSSPAPGLAAWNGTAWRALAPDIDGSVYALTVYNASLVVGGSFTFLGGVTANYVAMWDGGTTWLALNAGTNAPVLALATFGSLLAAGGSFTAGNWSVGTGVVLWNGTDWSPTGLGTNGSTLALVEFDGSLVAGGAFTVAGGTQTNYSAVWDGVQWAALQGGAPNNGKVTALAVYCAHGSTGDACDVCIAGHYGALCTECPDCGANGTCSDGVSGSGACLCDTGFAGTLCTVCEAGYYGASCAACPDCGTHGQCNDGVAGNGTCSCTAGWTGSLCTDCATDYVLIGTRCTKCLDCVHGACNANASCTCNDGWAGARCTSCADALTYGPNCNETCPACVYGACSSGPSGTGNCVCSSGLYTGTLCDECVYGYYMNTTTHECVQCVPCNHGTCNTTTGACNCSSGWTGASCGDCASGYVLVGSNCTVCTDSTCSTGGLVVSIGLIIGIAAALFVVVVAIIVAFAIHRHRILTANKMISDYKLQLLTMNHHETSKEVLGGTLRFNLTVPQAPTDPDILDSIVPVYLLMETEIDLKIVTRLIHGGSSTFYRGTVVNKSAIERNGSDTCAIKEIVPAAGVSVQATKDVFHHEVLIMWALSFHPNIIKLTGYCEQPQLIITPYYKADVSRFLHGQKDKTPLEAYLLLHLCTGMAAAVAAVHGLGIAHRDIKTSNFLIETAKAGFRYPNAVLAEFGLARTADETAVAKVRGLSHRYTAPEVFARALFAKTSNTIEDDKAADVYSLGVVFWECTCRRVPWEGLTNEEIQITVGGGGRVEPLEVVADDPISATINAIIERSLALGHDMRPGAATIHSALLKCIRALLREGQSSPA